MEGVREGARVRWEGWREQGGGEAMMYAWRERQWRKGGSVEGGIV